MLLIDWCNESLGKYSWTILVLLFLPATCSGLGYF